MGPIAGKLRLASLLCATLLLASCDPQQIGAGLNLESRPDVGAEKAVAAKLAHGYGLLADYDDYVANDSAAGVHFRSKQEQAGSGAMVEPDPSDGPDTEQARALLDRARSALKGGDYATAYAEAQINYDCWVDRRGRQEKSASFCKDKLYKAVARLNLAPPRNTSPSEQHFAIYFRKGTAVPDSAAFTTIRQAAAAYVDSPDWHVHITGHAYGEKNKKADVLLSMRRAIAVRNVLLQNGVDAGRIVVGAIGDTGGSKADGGRVDISIIEASRDQPDQGPDIQKIVPQYFGKDEPEL